MEEHVGKLSKKLRKFLKLHRSLTVDNEKNRIKCCLTGHEMPCTDEAVQSYVNGKKFQKARHRESGNYEQYRPHIIPSTKKYHEHQLFCMLTLRHINMTPDHVARHVNGARYKRALARFQECEKKGIKFVPKRKRQDAAAEANERSENDNSMEEFGSGSESGSDGEETGDQDNYEDLYPAEDFEDKTKDEDEASDFDFDDEDTVEEKKTENVASASKTSEDGESSKPSKRKGEKKKHKRNKKKQRTG